MIKAGLLAICWFMSANALARCAQSPHGEARVRLLSITPTAKSNKQCGVELEVLDALKQHWLKKGEHADFWSEDPAICQAPVNSERTLVLSEDCCDALYDWCEAKWNVNGVEKRARGRRILNQNSNRTF